MIKDQLLNFLKSNRDLVFNLLAVVFLSVASYIFWNLSSDKDIAPFTYYFFKLISITFLLGAFHKIVETFPENRFKTWLYFLTGIPMAVAMFILQVVRVLSVTLVAFGILLFFQEITWQIAVLILPRYLINLDFKVYLMFVISLVLLAYWGPRILFQLSKFLPDNDDPEIAVKHVLNWFLNRINFRRRAYEIGIIVLIFASIENIINLNLFSFPVWLSLKGIALEAFITFLAIDRYIINYYPSLLKNNDLETETNT